MNNKTIIDYGKIIYQRRWVIILLMIAIMGFTLVNSLISPKGYTAAATIFPTTIGQSGLASFLSNPLGGTAKQDANILIVLFKSRKIAGVVAQKLDLEDKLAESLFKKIRAYLTKDGMVELSIEVKDAALAKRIINTYITAVAENLSSNSISVNFVVIDPARASSRPTSPNLKANLLAAFIVSIILGISFSLLDDYFRLILK